MSDLRRRVAQELGQTIDHGRDYTWEWLLHQADRILALFEQDRAALVEALERLAHEWESFPRGDTAPDATYAYAKEDCASSLRAALGPAKAGGAPEEVKP